jgi:hypothetical protein
MSLRVPLVAQEDTMARHIVRIFVALTALLLWTAPAATAAKPVPVPSRAEFFLDASFVPTATPGVFAVTGSGSGRATHLGQVTVSTSELVDFTVSPGTVTIRGGEMVVVAANGDELYSNYSGGGSLPDVNGVVSFSGTFTITGGTGRFSDATGGGTFEGEGNVVTGDVVVSYQGTIRY